MIILRTLSYTAIYIIIPKAMVFLLLLKSIREIKGPLMKH